MKSTHRDHSERTWPALCMVGLGFLCLVSSSLLPPFLAQDGDSGATATAKAPAPETTYTDQTCPDAEITDEPREPGTWSIPEMDLTAPFTDDTHWTSPVLPDATAGIRYEPSMPVGSKHGATILAGHVDYAPGALSEAGGELSPWGHLHEAKPCQQLTVTTDDGKAHHYWITGLDTTDQDQLTSSTESSTWAEQLFRADGDPNLYLITCSGPAVGDAGGAFQFGYADNLIVTATPIDQEAI